MVKASRWFIAPYDSHIHYDILRVHCVWVWVWVHPTILPNHSEKVNILITHASSYSVGLYMSSSIKLLVAVMLYWWCITIVEIWWWCGIIATMVRVAWQRKWVMWHDRNNGWRGIDISDKMSMKIGWQHDSIDEVALASSKLCWCRWCGTNLMAA